MVIFNLIRTYIKSNHDQLDRKIQVSQQQTRRSLDRQDTVLNEIRSRLDETNRRLGSGSSIANVIQLTLNQLGHEFKKLVQGMIVANFATYTAVLQIQQQLRVSNSLINPLTGERIFYLEDAMVV